MRATFVFALLGLLLQTPPHRSDRISADEIMSALYQHSECNDPANHTITIDHFEYHDFMGDGQEQAIVVASTCMAGTGGPDVHAVYGRDAAGKLVELPFQHEPLNNPLPLFGNRNYTFTVEDGLLVERYRDTSDRDEPLVISYKWNGSAFAVASVKKAGPFKTSYDCTKATQEVEVAICYSVAVSALDVELANLYRERLRILPADQKSKLQEEQRAWLVQRNKCIIYKFWVESLTELYKKRIGELRQLSK